MVAGRHCGRSGAAAGNVRAALHPSTRRRIPWPLHQCKAPRTSRGFAGSPHRCGFISSRHRNVCRPRVTGVGVELARISSIGYLPFVGRPDCGDIVRLQDRLPDPSCRPHRHETGRGRETGARVPAHHRHQRRHPLAMQLPLQHRTTISRCIESARTATSTPVSHFTLTDDRSNCRAPRMSLISHARRGRTRLPTTQSGRRIDVPRPDSRRAAAQGLRAVGAIEGRCCRSAASGL